MGTEDLKNVRQVKIYLRYEQDEFIDQVVDTVKKLNPESKINRSDVVRNFIDRFANYPEDKEGSLIRQALGIITAYKGSDKLFC